MKRSLWFALTVSVFLLLLPCSASAEERVVLTIGDTTERSGSRYNEDLGFWHYLEDLADVEIEYMTMLCLQYKGGSYDCFRKLANGQN